MKKQKLPAREPVQLHIDPTPAETTPEYTLEDIMNEFGGWTKREPEPAAASPEPEPPKPEKPEETPTPETSETPEAAPQEAETVRPAEPAPKEDKQPDLSAQTMRFAPVTAEPPKPEQPTIWTYKGEPAPEAPDVRTRLSKDELRERQRQKKLERQRQKQEKRRARRQEQPERTFSSPEEAYSFYCKPDSLRLRLLLCCLLTLASAVLLVLAAGVFTAPTTHLSLFSALMLIFMILQAILCLDVLAEGFFAAIRLKFDLNSLLLLVVLVCAADAVFALLGGRIPFCTVVSVELTVGLEPSALKIRQIPHDEGRLQHADAHRRRSQRIRLARHRLHLPRPRRPRGVYRPARNAGRREALRAHLHAGRRAADAGAFRAGRAPQRA